MSTYPWALIAIAARSSVSSGCEQGCRRRRSRCGKSARATAVELTRAPAEEVDVETPAAEILPALAMTGADAMGSTDAPAWS
jgi:hypothetical protein